MRKKISLYALITVATFAMSCKGDPDSEPDGNKQSEKSERSVPLAITGSITDVFDAEWKEKDAIGIYMLKGANAESANKKYIVAAAGATGTFSPATNDQTIYFPKDGAMRDFAAYYPFATIETDNLYTINVASQASQQSISLMAAEKITNKNSATPALRFVFSHKLTKLDLSIKGDGVSITDKQLAGTVVKITNQQTTGTYNVVTGGNVSPANNAPAEITLLTTADGLKSEGVVLPNTDTQDMVLTFSVPMPINQTFRWVIKSGKELQKLEANKKYACSIKLSESDITVSYRIIDRTTNAVIIGETSLGETEQRDIVIEKALIKAGAFMMGSPTTEPFRVKRESQHSVTISKDYYMSKHEITNAQYAAFLNANSIGSNGKGKVSYNKDGSQIITEEQVFITEDSNHPWGVTHNGKTWMPNSGYKQHPVINVTWYGAKAFADWAKGSLPTEAQWEYACRGTYNNKETTTATFPFGIGDNKKLDGSLANINGRYIYDYDAGGHKDMGEGNGAFIAKTTPVGSYAANNYGLYDMHGNVYEWCDDWYGDYGSTITDPTGPDKGSERVIRGSAWKNYAQFCRSAFRIGIKPESPGNDVGFRVVFASVKTRSYTAEIHNK